MNQKNSQDKLMTQQWYIFGLHTWQKKAKELYKKLHEECNEVEMAKNKEEITMELADVYEVLLAVMLYNDIKLEEVEASALIKRNKRGGFSKRIYLEKTYDK